MRVLIIDSFALLFRGYYAMALAGNHRVTSYGLPTNGLYQFTKYMLHAIETYQPTHVVCAFDMGASTFRNELYASYKANRQAPPDALIPQFDKCWELVESFNIPCVGVQGFEADDVIGTLAKEFAHNNAEVTILTGDGDTLQLIDERVRVSLMKRGFGNYELVHKDNIQELRGIVSPKQIIDLKALMGDASDNIPGCPNVGEKTALKLIQQFETLENLFERIDEVNGKLKDRLLENKEIIYLSKTLATIKTDVAHACSFESCSFEIDAEKVTTKFTELEFNSLLKSIPQVNV
jgi:5'-3' exonuclease